MKHKGLILVLALVTVGAGCSSGNIVGIRINGLPVPPFFLFGTG